MKNLLWVSLLFLSGLNLNGQNNFITTWKTDYTGTTGNTEIKIPTYGLETYNYDVDWNNDGVWDDIGITGDITHDYGVAGTYQVAIRGDFPRIYFNGGGDRRKILSIDQWGDIQWTNMFNAFRGCENLTSTATDAPDLSGVNDMSGMFKQASSFNADLSSWDVSTITNMESTFSEAYSFNGELIAWDVSNVTNMNQMFFGAASFNKDLNLWDVSAVTNMRSMFYNADVFNGDISTWDVSAVTNMWSMFRQAFEFNSDLSTWDVSAVTDMSNMFWNCHAFNSDLSTWDVSAVTNMQTMFFLAYVFDSDLGSWDVSAVTNMYKMFFRAYQFDCDLNAWDVSSVTNMREMFLEASSFNGNISAWDVSSVTDMAKMFGDATLFNQDLSAWDVSAVTSTIEMFREASSFTSDLSNWNVSAVTNMQYMFDGATAFNSNLNAWDVSSVTSMLGMFRSTQAFNSDLNTWDVQAVTNMEKMFLHATSFNGDISTWDVGHITSLFQFFYGATSYNGDLSAWDVSSVESMRQMFGYASSFNQDLSSWNISAVTNMQQMLDNSGLDVTNYDNTLIGWAAQTVQPNVTLGAAALNYCNSIVERTSLINDDGWTIIGDTEECPNQAPVAICHAVAVSADANCEGTAVAADFDGGSYDPEGGTLSFSVVPVGPYPLGVTTVTLTVTDDAGATATCTQDITVTDNTAPGISCPANIEIFATSPAGVVVNFIDPVGTDNCAGTTTLQTGGLASGETFPIGTTTNTFTATDAVGLNTSCSFDVIVSEPFEPFITTWKTDNTGTSGNTEITIPTYGLVTYNYDVDWNNDGVWDDIGVTGNITHDYGVAGTYQVAIRGDFPAIYFIAGGDKQKILSIDQWGDIEWATMVNAFNGCANLTFAAVDVPDLSGVTDMRNMFYQATSFNADLSFWDVSTVTDMQGTFSYASSFNGDISTWDVSNVTNMLNMFIGATSFNQDLNLWDVGNVTNMRFMFYDAEVFNGDINTWDVSNVTNMNGMFNGAINFNQSIGSWDVSSVTNMNAMFEQAVAFNQPLANWDVSNVTDMSRMFLGDYYNPHTFNQDISSWDVSSVTDMNAMFFYTSSFNQPIGIWDVSSVTNMSYMFRSASTFNQDINSWNVTNVTNMSNMFNYASAYNQPLGNWDVSNVINMSFMFTATSSFNQDISSWDVGNVTNMERMFLIASVFNQPLGGAGGWDVSSVTKMTNMFFNAPSFNQNISSWDVSNVTDMYGMFYGTVSFDQPLIGWDVSSVTNMRFMFQSSAFNQDLGSWDVSNVTDMGWMFYNASAFNQDIGVWDIGSVTDLYNMLNNSGLDVTNYDNTLIGWAAQTVQPNITLGANALHYCNAIAERTSLINDDGWSIVGDTEECPSQPPVAVCQAVVVSADANCEGTAVAADFDGGSYDPEGGALSFSVVPVGPYPLGVTTVTLTVTDDAGETSTCMQDITVTDTDAPVFASGTGTSTNVMNGIYSGGSADVVAISAFDGAYVYGGGNLGYSCNDYWRPRGTLCDESPTTNDPLVSTKTNNNSGATWSNYSGTGTGVLVVDLSSPQLLNEASVFQMFSDGKVTHLQGFYHPSTSETPPLESDGGWVELFPQTLIGPGTQSGNEVTDPTLISFSSTTSRYVMFYVQNDGSNGSPYYIEIRNIKLFGGGSSSGGSGNCSTAISVSTDAGACEATQVSLVTPEVFDNCGVQSITHNAPVVFPLGVTEVLWTASDAAGNTATCAQEVTVSDNEAPVIACPEDIIGVIATGAAGATVTYTTPVGTDNCTPTTTLTAGLASGSTFPIGTTTNTFTVTDEAGNSTSCSFDVTVEGLPPVIVCPTDITVNTESGLCSAVVTYAATETTGLPASTITYSINPGSTFEVGTTSVTATAINTAGSDDCVFTVTVVDNEAPIVECIDITLDLDSQCSASIVPEDVIQVGGSGFSSSSQDLSPEFTVSGNFADFDGDGDLDFFNGNRVSVPPWDAGMNSVVWMNDGNGSYAPGATLFNCNLVDSDVGDLDGDGDIDIFIANKGCDNNVWMNDGNGSFAVHQILAGNNAFCVKLADFDGDGDLDAVSGSDNSQPNRLFLNDGTGTFTMSGQDIGINGRDVDSGDLDGDGDLDFVFATEGAYDLIYLNDGSGNFTTNGQNLNFGSNTRGAVLGDLDGDNDLDIYFGIPSGNDLVYLNDGSAVFTATGQSLNISGSKFPEIVDFDNDGDLDVITNTGNMSPVLLLNDGTATFTDSGLEFPPGVWETVFGDIDGDGDLDIGFAIYNGPSQVWLNGPAPMLSDNCGIGSLTVTPNSFSSSDVGANLVTLTVTDVNNNIATCEVTVTVQDLVVPVIICPGNINEIATSAAGAIVTYNTPVGTDNCTVTTVQTAGLASGSTFPIGTTINTFEVTDPGNNNTSCSFTVTVTGVAPDIICPENITVNTETGLCSADITYVATDNVGIPASTITYSVDPGSTFGLGTITVTATATNAVGSDDCTFSVSVVDNEAPVADVDPLPDATGECAVILTAPTATDNCEGTITATTPDPTSYTAQGTYMVTWTYDDGNGNTSQQTQTIVISDVTYSEFDIPCPENIVLCGSQIVNWIEPTATDNCGISDVNASHNPGEIFEVGTTPVTYDFTDEGGNTISCGFDIVIHPLPDISIVKHTVPDFCQGLTLLEVTVNNAGDLELPFSYDWSGNMGTEPELIVTETGLYEVTVTDANGCESIATYDVVDDPSDAISAYVIIAEKEVDLKETNVYGGGVGVMGAGKKAKVKQNSTVDQFVKASDINIDNGSTIGTMIEERADLVLPPFYSFDDKDCDGEDVDVDKDEVITLTGILYDEIDVDKGGTIIFDMPEVYVSKINTKDDVTLEFLQSTNIMVDSDMKLDKDNTIISNGHTVTFYVGKKVDFKEGADVTANIFANDDIKVKGKSNNMSQMIGLFISMDKITSEKYVDWYPNSGCDPAILESYPMVCGNESIEGIVEGFSYHGLGEINSIKVYPNPTFNFVMLKVDVASNTDFRIEIKNVLGEAVYVENQDLTKGENLIRTDLSYFSNGIYYFNLYSSEIKKVMPVFKVD